MKYGAERCTPKYASIEKKNVSQNKNDRNKNVIIYSSKILSKIPLL